MMRRIGLGMLLLASFLVGSLVGKLVGYEQAARITPIYSMRPELQAEAKRMFANLADKKATIHVALKLLDNCRTEVAVAGKFGNSTCGFVRTGSPLRNFWSNGEGFTVYRFDDYNLFVVIHARYMLELERDPVK